MFTENDLRELLDLSGTGPILSVYLNTEPSSGGAESYKLRIRNMLKNITLPEDVDAIERYFSHEYKGAGRGAAIFSSAGRGFFKAYTLALPVRDSYFIGEKPSVKPLANLLDNYGGYGVVLVDKQGARLFHFHLGELNEQEGVLGEEVKHIKRGGASSFPGRRGGTAGQTRAVEEMVDRNMKETADTAIHFFENKHIRRIVICGTDENVSLFRGMLPKAWQSLVVGSFPMPMTANHTDVLERALQTGLDAEVRREQTLVENLVTMGAKGGLAVLGLEETLQAVNHGRVQTLVVVEDLRKPGYYCKGCGALSTMAEKACEHCEGTVTRIPDVIELAVSAVFDHGGEVEGIAPTAGFNQSGGIGAFLRY